MAQQADTKEKKLQLFPTTAIICNLPPAYSSTTNCRLVTIINGKSEVPFFSGKSPVFEFVNFANSTISQISQIKNRPTQTRVSNYIETTYFEEDLFSYSIEKIKIQPNEKFKINISILSSKKGKLKLFADDLFIAE